MGLLSQQAIVDYANCTGTLNPDPGLLSCGLLSVTTEFMYQNYAITYQDRTDEFTRVTLIISDSQIQCPAGCNEGDSNGCLTLILALIWNT
jgi:hypothetical protein